MALPAMVQVLLRYTGPDRTLPLGDPLLVRIFRAAPLTPPGSKTGGQGAVHSAFTDLNRKKIHQNNDYDNIP
jgi:hypothetical protein